MASQKILEKTPKRELFKIAHFQLQSGCPERFFAHPSKCTKLNILVLGVEASSLPRHASHSPLRQGGYSMSWEHVLAVLAGWIVLPGFAWVLAHEVLRLIRS